MERGLPFYRKYRPVDLFRVICLGMWIGLVDFLHLILPVQRVCECEVEKVHLNQHIQANFGEMV